MKIRVQYGDYPNRPLTLVVGFAPGGPNDILGRQLAKALTQRLEFFRKQKRRQPWLG